MPFARYFVTSLLEGCRAENLLRIDLAEINALGVSEEHPGADLMVDGRIID